MSWLFLSLCIVTLVLVRIAFEGRRHQARRPAPRLNSIGDDIHRRLLLGPTAER